MSEEPPERSLLIGLHKLAEQNGEGLVPELFALLARSDQRSVPYEAKILAFPAAAKSAAGLAHPVVRPVGEAGGSVVPMRRP